jgi:spore coat polysaccharide biosynthesis protein SpsF
MVGAIVQARMGSSRLPGKVLMKAAGKPLLELLIERLRLARTLDTIVVATSTAPQDDAIVEFCNRLAVPTFRGSEHDLVDRYLSAANAFGIDVVVRITADCPLIDPAIVDTIVSRYLAEPNDHDLVTNRHPLTFPDGLDVDVMPIAALTHVWRHAAEPHQREHTLPFFWESGMRVLNIEHPGNLFTSERWTLDYAEDYQLIRAIFEGLYDAERPFGMSEVLTFLDNNPDLRAINAKYLPDAPR